MGAEIYDARIRPSGINKTGIYVAKTTMGLNWNYNHDNNWDKQS